MAQLKQDTHTSTNSCFYFQEGSFIQIYHEEIVQG